MNQSLEPAAGIVMTPLVALALAVVSVQVLGITAGAIATIGGLVLLRLSRGLGPPPPPVPPRPDGRDVARRDRPRRRGAGMTA